MGHRRSAQQGKPLGWSSPPATSAVPGPQFHGRVNSCDDRGLHQERASLGAGPPIRPLPHFPTTNHLLDAAEVVDVAPPYFVTPSLGHWAGVAPRTWRGTTRRLTP